MIPLSDGIPARRVPIVNVALIVASFVATVAQMVMTLLARDAGRSFMSGVDVLALGDAG